MAVDCASTDRNC